MVVGVGHGLDSLVGIRCRQTDGDGPARFERRAERRTDGLGNFGSLGLCLSGHFWYVSFFFFSLDQSEFKMGERERRGPADRDGKVGTRPFFAFGAPG